MVLHADAHGFPKRWAWFSKTMGVVFHTNAHGFSLKELLQLALTKNANSRGMRQNHFST